MDFVLPWYVAGPLIGLIIPLLLVLNEKQFGVSSSLRVVVSFFTPKVNYFRYNRKKDYWQLYFGIGVILVSILIVLLDVSPSPQIDSELSFAGIATSVYSLQSWPFFLIGGALIGFGARYAGGCTAGHCVMGNSLLSTSSLVSTVSFFVGGLIVSHFVIPQFLGS